MIQKLNKLFFEIKQTTNEWFDDDKVCVRPYLSYATQDKVIIRGRVLEDEGVVKIEDNTTWDNFVQTIRMLESDEVKHTPIVIEFNDQVFNTETDDEGYFYFEIPHKFLELDSASLQWQMATVSASEHIDEKGKASAAQARFLMPHSRTQHIIVSDVDDTIVETGVNSFLKLQVIFNTLFHNHQSRTPFEGIAEVLHQLCLDATGNRVNPIFYLSNSPWNLYHLILGIFKFRDIPLGPIFLRDFGLHFGEDKRAFHNHKKRQLERLMIDFPNQKFILIGDATEKDAPIYLEVFNEFPTRVKKIFIRASFKEKKNQKIQDLIIANPDAPIHLISHSDEIIELINKSKF